MTAVVVKLLQFCDTCSGSQLVSKKKIFGIFPCSLSHHGQTPIFLTPTSMTLENVAPTQLLWPLLLLLLAPPSVDRSVACCYRSPTTTMARFASAALLLLLASPATAFAPSATTTPRVASTELHMAAPSSKRSQALKVRVSSVSRSSQETTVDESSRVSSERRSSLDTITFCSCIHSLMFSLSYSFSLTSILLLDRPSARSLASLLPLSLPRPVLLPLPWLPKRPYRSSRRPTIPRS